MEVEVGIRRTGGGPISETPFCVLVMGDFSGRESRGAAEPESIKSRPLLEIDRDNFDDVLAKMNVRLRLPAGSASSEIEVDFAELDDFHPDRLYEHVPLFAGLKRMRDRLADSATFAETAAGLGRPPTSATPAKRPAAAKAQPEPEAGPGLLDAALEATSQEAPSLDNPQQIDELIRRIVAPHVVPKADPRQAEMIESVDQATTALMRSLLHHRAFQRTEALWRGAYLLIRRLETGRDLKILLLDVTKEELAADLVSRSELARTGAYKAVAERSVAVEGGRAWGVIVAAFDFAHTAVDAALLWRLAAVAEAADAALIGGADPGHLACRSLAETPDPDDWRPPEDKEAAAAWSDLRQRGEASYVGLIMPRFLVRRTYGKQSDPLESFDFEEIESGAPHENYLWGNPAFVAACLLGQSFLREGWALRPGIVDTLEGLPLFVDRRGGDADVLPCGEALLVDRAAEAIAAAGIMPLRSIRDRDAVRLPAFRSLTDDTIRGHWTSEG